MADDPDRLWAENTPPHRYDAPATVFVKRALQEGLPDGQREELLDALFHEYVTDDDEAFADSLYLTLDGCRELVRRGHEVIGHGWQHRRLGLLDEAAQRDELERTRDFVEDVGGTWALCYPYGSRNETTLAPAPRASAARPPSRPTLAARRRPTRCSSCRGSTRTTYSSR